VIELEGVTKSYPTQRGRHYVLRDVDLKLPGDVHIGVIGSNGAGKSTLLRLLGGIDFPERGRITGDANVSWPLGLQGGFQGAMTGRENVRFVCRIYDEDIDGVMAFVEGFTELGRFLEAPVGTYSSGMKARLGFALSLAVDFDVYLIDELTSVGDADFKRKCQAALDERRERATTIVVSHSPKTIKQLCQRVALLRGADLEWYDDVDAALAAYDAA